MEYILRGSADEQAETLAHRDRHREYDALPDQTVGDCPLCQTTETVMIGDRCHQCYDAARWSRDNRRWCDLIHRKADG